MASASIVINQGVLPAGVGSRTRDDLATGAAVQLSNANDSGVRSWRWQLLGRPPGSLATISNPTAANPTFTPDVVGTYRIRLAINAGLVGQTDTRLAIVRDPNGLRVPAVGEADEANYLLGGIPNADGYTPDLQALLELVRLYLGSGPPGSGGIPEGHTTRRLSIDNVIGANNDPVLWDLDMIAPVGCTWVANGELELPEGKWQLASAIRQVNAFGDFAQFQHYVRVTQGSDVGGAYAATSTASMAQDAHRNVSASSIELSVADVDATAGPRYVQLRMLHGAINCTVTAFHSFMRVRRVG